MNSGRNVMLYDNYSVFADRRKRLIESIQSSNNTCDGGAVLLCASLEGYKHRFRQDSTFYYFTGIVEPGAMLTLELNGKVTLYIPQYEKNRAQWVQNPIEQSIEFKTLFLVDEICYLGEKSKGYALGEVFHNSEHAILLNGIQEIIEAGGMLYGYSNSYHTGWQARRFQRVCESLKVEVGCRLDISSVVATMRRVKDSLEIEKMEKAAEITAIAHDYVARLIHHCEYEYELQALIQYSFLQQEAMGEAFPSIVAGGENAATLHYTGSAKKLLNGELVVVDIGAEYDYYCADMTRTYPVSGIFSEEQSCLYNVVLDVQKYAASIARPGLYLNNKNKPDRSLHHLAFSKLDDLGYAKYFVHGIGHFLGLDVHDVGDSATELKQGDVITIEPGIYMPEKCLGIRIEDDYLIEEDGCRCLSDLAHKEIEGIEHLMKR